MNSVHSSQKWRIAGKLFVMAITLSIVPCGFAEEKPADRDYRVANEPPAAQSPAGQAAPAATVPANGSPFDLTQKPGEHPLMPAIRVVKATQDLIDQSVRDYSCTLIKQERVEGELGEEQQIMLKVMQEPFSVYMSFLKPFAGREVAYVTGQNDGNLVVLETGFKRMLGKMNLDPQGSLAMKGQRHPITDVGVRNLMVKLTKMWEAETKFAECEVTSNATMKIDGRPTTMIQVLHPIPRQDFKFHAARLFIDNELKVPIHFDAYMWPEKEGEDAPLEESYTYRNMKLNNGFTALQFDAKNNPEIFKQ